MTLEEKIAEIRSSSMEAARAEGNDIIESYRRALEKVFEDHKPVSYTHLTLPTTPYV